MRPKALWLAVCAGLCACTPASQTAGVGRAPAQAEYLGVETRLLDGDLVNFRVQMRGARGAADVTEYAECAAALYTLVRGFGFARHLRTTAERDGAIWRADAVYTISAALPAGLRTLDAEVVVRDCTEKGIPSV